jgi:hypothetical protein
MNNDGSWRSAFQYHFRALPINRAYPLSWKQEYLHRIELELNWKQAQKHVLVNPRLQSLDRLHQMQDGIVIGSLESGGFVHCDPQTGKIARQVMYASTNSLPTSIGALEFHE